MITSESMRSTVPDPVHVAVAIVSNTSSEILVSRRSQHTHLAGMWEFPGGKLEQGETVFHALCREIREEVGIQIHHAHPLIRVRHNYPEKSVILDTWRVSDWSGVPEGLEGQEIRWVKNHNLTALQMPAADRPILKSLAIPPVYQISPEPDQDQEDFLLSVEASLKTGVKLFQLRSTSLTGKQLTHMAHKIRQLCDRYNARWLINGSPESELLSLADGLHLNSKHLLSIKQRPFGVEKLLAVSCHNHRELQHASNIDADFAVLSPVAATQSHPHLEPMGWETFAKLVESVDIPVYALGGMKQSDLETARIYGAQGVAMISAGWKRPER